jgi:hypothetical protein
VGTGRPEHPEPVRRVRVRDHLPFRAGEPARAVARAVAGSTLTTADCPRWRRRARAVLRGGLPSHPSLSWMHGPAAHGAGLRWMYRRPGPDGRGAVSSVSRAAILSCRGEPGGIGWRQRRQPLLMSPPWVVCRNAPSSEDGAFLRQQQPRAAPWRPYGHTGSGEQPVQEAAGSVQTTGCQCHTAVDWRDKRGNEIGTAFVPRPSGRGAGAWWGERVSRLDRHPAIRGRSERVCRSRRRR